MNTTIAHLRTMRHPSSTPTKFNGFTQRSNVQTEQAWRLRTIVGSTARQPGQQPPADRRSGNRVLLPRIGPAPTGEEQVRTTGASGAGEASQGEPSTCARHHRGRASTDGTSARTTRLVNLITVSIAALVFANIVASLPLPPPLPQPDELQEPTATKQTLADRGTADPQA